MSSLLDSRGYGDEELRNYRQSYIWLTVITFMSVFVSLVYFSLNVYARQNNFWVYDYYPYINAIFLVLRIPVFVIGMVKVKPIPGKLAIIGLLVFDVAIVAYDWIERIF